MTSICLICNDEIGTKDMRNPSQDNPIIINKEDNNVGQILPLLLKLFQMPISSFGNIDLEHVPKSLLCANCHERIDNSSHILEEISTLQKKLSDITGEIKETCINSYNNSEANFIGDERQIPVGFTRVQNIRSVCVQYWSEGFTGRVTRQKTLNLRSFRSSCDKNNTDVEDNSGVKTGDMNAFIPTVRLYVDDSDGDAPPKKKSKRQKKHAVTQNKKNVNSKARRGEDRMEQPGRTRSKRRAVCNYRQIYSSDSENTSPLMTDDEDEPESSPLAATSRSSDADDGDLKAKRKRIRLKKNKRSKQTIPEYGFKCDGCQRTFKTESALEEHAAEASSSTWWQCRDCNHHFSKFWYLRKHQKRVHSMDIEDPPDEEVKLKKNSKKQTTNVTEEEQLLSKTDSSTTKSDSASADESSESVVASRNDTSDESLVNLTLSVSKILGPPLAHTTIGPDGKKKHDADFECNLCGEKFVRRINYDYHMRKHANPDAAITKYIQAQLDDQRNVIAFDCAICNRHFIKHDHLNEKGNLEIICDHGNCTCGITYCLMEEFVNHHKEICTMKYRSSLGGICNICGSRFKNEEGLIAHRKIVHPDPAALQFICDLCGKGYETAGYLKRHMVSAHTTVKAFKCHLCEYSAKTKPQYVDHIKRHNNDLSFVCHECGKQFVNRKQLKRHEETHIQVATIPCPVCFKLFRNKHNLQNHIYSTHEKRRQTPKSIADSEDVVSDSATAPLLYN